MAEIRVVVDPRAAWTRKRDTHHQGVLVGRREHLVEVDTTGHVGGA